MMEIANDLKRYAEGFQVELPGFVAGESFYVKLRRPSLLEMVQSGKIPNPLLNAAAELFQSGAARAAQGGKEFKEMAEVLLCVARAALVEPSFEEFEKAGINLTDMQLLYLYNFVSSGVDVLKSFRKEPGTSSRTSAGKGTRGSAQ